MLPAVLHHASSQKDLLHAYRPGDDIRACVSTLGLNHQTAIQRVQVPIWGVNFKQCWKLNNLLRWTFEKESMGFKKKQGTFFWLNTGWFFGVWIGASGTLEDSGTRTNIVYPLFLILNNLALSRHVKFLEFTLAKQQGCQDTSCCESLFLYMRHARSQRHNLIQAWEFVLHDWMLEHCILLRHGMPFALCLCFLRVCFLRLFLGLFQRISSPDSLYRTDVENLKMLQSLQRCRERNV